MDSTPREPSSVPPRGTQLRLFVAVSPGLEATLTEELEQLGLHPRTVVGGADVSGGFDALMQIHLWSRLAESVRLRLKAFHATSFQTLEAEFARLPWHAYLRPELATHFSVTCHKSRLYHSEAVAERCQRSIEARFKKKLLNVARADAAQTVAVRLTGDTVQTSIDASGERLHRRGYRTHVGEAPLRETLAAALVRSLRRVEPAVAQPPVIWDPFCGSGTLLLEWLSASLNIAPGASRSFAFETWPIFAPYQAELDALRARLQAPLAPPHNVKAIGSDLDAKALAAAENNARCLGVSENVRLIHGDFENALSSLPAQAAVLTNPPYGKRLGRSDDLPRLYQRFEALLRERPGLRPVVLACGLPNFRFELPWQRLTQVAHGGLRVTLLRLE